MLSYKTVCCIFFVCFHGMCEAVVFGSNTAPSRQPLAVFPAADTDNEMRGFGAFENGFTLQTAATRCLFNSVFPIGSTVTLNGGTVNLNLDLMFDSNARIINGGLFNSALRIISLPDLLSTFPVPNGLIVNNGILVCNSDINLNGTLRINGQSILSGQNNTINFGSSGQLVIGSGASLLIKDMICVGVHSGNFFCADSAGICTLENTKIVFDASYSFTQGRFDVIGSCVFTGTQIFAYQSASTSRILSDSLLFFDTGMTFSYIPPVASGTLLTLFDSTSILHLYETTLYSTPTGLTFTKGVVRVDGLCPVRSDALVLAEAISLGDGISAANDVTVEIYPESGFDVTSGFLVYKNVAG